MSKQAQVLVAKTHVMGLRDGERKVYASDMLGTWSYSVQAITGVGGKDPILGLRENSLCFSA